MEIDVTYGQGERSDEVADAIKRLMIARHGQEDFTLITQDKMLEILGDILNLLTVGVGAIGAISLVVGAFGIATIMTIAVNERTVEVGLMRALGAPRAQILSLFLAEAAFLGSAGGVVGIAIAVTVVAGVELLVPALPLTIVWSFVGIALAVSLLIGLLSGLLPATRAAGMDPVEALRTE